MKNFNYYDEIKSINKTLDVLTDDDISFLCDKNKLVMEDSIIFCEDLRILRELYIKAT